MENKQQQKSKLSLLLSNCNILNLFAYMAFSLYYVISLFSRIINLFRFKAYASLVLWSNIFFSLIMLTIFVLLALHTSNVKLKILQKFKFTKQKEFTVPFVLLFCKFIINDLLIWALSVLGHDVLSELLLRACIFVFMVFALLFIKHWSDQIMKCIRTKRWSFADTVLRTKLIIALVTFILLLIPCKLIHTPTTSSGTDTSNKCSICGDPATHGSFCAEHFDDFVKWQDKQD